MRQFIAGIVGGALLIAPGWMLFNGLQPVPQYQTGTFEDYRHAVNTLGVLYGGGAGGILVFGRFTGRVLGGSAAFIAGTFGVMATTVAVLLGPALYRLLTGESPALGNLWGLVVILGAIAAIPVAGGAGLVLYAIRGPERGTP